MRSWLAARLPSVWLRRGPVAWCLLPLAWLFGRVVALRRLLYRSGLLPSHRLPVPVVVVGNVVAGGSGKTPVTIALVEHLQRRGWRVGMVSRGYGRRTRDVREVDAHSLAQDVGDEPALVYRRCGVPVVVAARRVDAARTLLKRHPGTQILVCDDGLQHLALARDVEICVFDDRGAGNGWLLPAGPLREPWPRATDLVVHTGDHPSFAGWHAQRAFAEHVVRLDGTSTALQTLAGRPVLAIAGIAQPARFFAMLRAAGLGPVVEQPLPDHHDFDAWTPPHGSPGTWLCTEKDAVKLWRRHATAWAVPLELRLPEGLLLALERLLAARVPSSLPHSAPAAHGQQAP